MLRKLAIIFVTIFFSQEQLQLHLALLIVMVAFALHHTFLPFDVNSTPDSDDGGGGHLLHQLERNSLLVLLFLLWSASVFYLDQTSCSAFTCNALAVVVVPSNVVFLTLTLRHFVIHFLKRTKLGAKISNMVGKGGGASGFVNPMRNLKDSAKRISGRQKGRATRPRGVVTFSSSVRKSLEMSVSVASQQSSLPPGKVDDFDLLELPRGSVNPLSSQPNEEDRGAGMRQEELRVVFFDEVSGRRYRVDSETGDATWIDEEVAETVFFDQKTKRRYNHSGWVD